MGVDTTIPTTELIEKLEQLLTGAQEATTAHTESVQALHKSFYDLGYLATQLARRIAKLTATLAVAERLAVQDPGPGEEVRFRVIMKDRVQIFMVDVSKLRRGDVDLRIEEQK